MTLESLKRRADKLAEKNGEGNVVLIFKDQQVLPDPLQAEALSECWPSWQEDTRDMSTEQILADERYRVYERRHYGALAAEERARGNIPIVLDAEDRDL